MDLGGAISRRRRVLGVPELVIQLISGVLPSYQIWARADHFVSSYEGHVRSPGPVRSGSRLGPGRPAKGPKMDLAGATSRRRRVLGVPELAIQLISGVVPSYQIWARTDHFVSSYQGHVRSPGPVRVRVRSIGGHGGGRPESRSRS